MCGKGWVWVCEYMGICQGMRLDHKMTLEIAYLCTKLVVPSTGSIIHVGLSVQSHGLPAAVDSSPMKL